VNCSPQWQHDRVDYEGKSELKLPITKLSELTGVHRDSISKRLVNLPFSAGKKGAKLYSSADALAAIYKMDSLEAARAEQARSAAQLNAIRADELRKTRIPKQLVLDTLDELMQAQVSTLKAATGKVLTMDDVNGIFANMAAIPTRLGWHETNSKV
jgi:hypothetical protein